LPVAAATNRRPFDRYIPTNRQQQSAALASPERLAGV
jgi:hypothetical protein